jgi:sporulation protein YlmC with PRC-barrel domain
MTSKVTPYLAAAAIALALPGFALAQSGTSSTPGASPAPAPIPAPSMNETKGPGSSSSLSSSTKQPFEASELKGKDVYDAAGKKVGSIDDVVPQTGQTRDVILSVGGILGIGSKKVLIPASDIERGNEGRLVVAMSEDQLDKLPEYERPRATTSPSGSAPARP